MKGKSIIGLLICIVFMLALSGCGENGKLMIKFKKGDSYKVEANNSSKTKMTISNQNNENDEIEKYVYNFKITDIDKDNTYTINSTIKSIYFKSTGSGGTYEYDSLRDTAKNDINSMMMTSFIGKSFTIKITPTGEVKEVTGFDELINTQIDNLPLGDEYKTTEKNILKQFFGKDSLKQQVEQMFKVYPDKKVNVGDKWSTKMSTSLGIPMIIDSTFQLKEEKDAIATVSEYSKIYVDQNKKTVKIDGMNEKANVSGVQNSTIKINENSGLIIDQEITQKLTGTIGMNKDKQSASQTVPVTEEITTSYKMSKL